MNILPTKGKTSKYRKRIKLFGVSKKRRLKNSWKEKVIKLNLYLFQKAFCLENKSLQETS